MKGAHYILVAVVVCVSLPLLSQAQAPEEHPPAALPNDTEAATKPTLDLTPDTNRSLSQAQMQELFRAVAAKDLENDKRLRDYAYIEREVQNKMDSKGQVQSIETKTYEVLQIYGEQVQRLTEKDDKPLSKKDADKEEEKIQKIIEKRKNESDSDRKKRLEREEKDREQAVNSSPKSRMPTISSWSGPSKSAVEMLGSSMASRVQGSSPT
jgi:hypothetical protein